MTKRIFDLIFSVLGIIIFSPLFLTMAILIKLDSRSPVFYRGARIGRNGKLFRIYKFRTMVTDAEKCAVSSTPENDPRLTKIGKFIRKYKVDELPQLFNIFKGEMSFVGPRPQVEWAVKTYNEEEKLLLTVRPGVTDYASIKFYNEDEILRGSKDPDKDYMAKIHPGKMRLGLEYIRNHSILIDIKIILKTMKLIFGRLTKQSS